MSKDGLVGNPQPQVESNKIRSTGSSGQPRHDRPSDGPDRTPGMPGFGGSKLHEPVILYFRLTESVSLREVDQGRTILSLDERMRCDKFLFERDRRDFVAAHALLRGVLSQHGCLPPDGWNFGTGVAGKPYLVGESELQFNIAHTRGSLPARFR
jgi:hypothetical protein